MALMKFKDFYSEYQDVSNDTGFDIDDLKHFDVYAQGGEKVGSVHDVLVDEADGRFRYFVVDTGFWIFGKKVLVPVGMTSMDQNDKRIYVTGLTKQQVEDLPNFDDLDKLDFEHEEQVRGVYRPSISAAGLGAATTAGLAGAAMPPMNTTSDASMDRTAMDRTAMDDILIDSTATSRTELDSAATSGLGVGSSSYTRDTYSYDRDPDLYNLNAQNNQTLRLYEERLLANKSRQKTGEVAIGKRVETETAHVEVPVERERVVIERKPVSGGSVVDPGSMDFQEGQVARMEVYEETPEIRKEAFVREEVQVKKVVEREVVEAEETLRREELDLDAQGNPTVDKRI